MTALDRFIEFVSPSWAAKRVAARANLERNKLLEEKLRGFKATSRGRRAGDDWNKVGEGTPTESTADLATLRVRARELRRNNPYWGNARRVIVAQVVGHGIRATAQGPNVRTKKTVQAAWDKWAATKVDATGKLDWYAVQKLVMRTVVQDGECIVRRIQTSNGLRLQVLGAEFLASERDGPTENGGEVMGGVEVDELGAPVAYHLYKRHPQSKVARFEVMRVLAADIAHVFEIDRPNQLRGESWVAPVFTRLADWDDYEDADLLRQKVSACFGAVYTGVEADKTEAGDYELSDKLEPGMIEHLPGGSDVKLIAPPASMGIRDAALINQRGIAAGLGITYEALTGDFERVNFSSARMGHMSMLANVHGWQQEVMIDLLCEPVWGWFMQGYSLKPGEELDEPISAVLNVTAKWVVPSRILIDPEKETSADMKRVRSGFAAWQDVVREVGLDPDQVADAIAEDMKRFDERGIVLDIDARKVSLQGQGSINQKQEGASDGSASKEQAAA